MTSLHKNYPGPQKAAVFFRQRNNLWERVMEGLNTYISNTHPKDICSLLYNLPSESALKSYSNTMLSTTRLLEEAFIQYQLPVVKRNFNNIWTQHLWLLPESKEKTYHFFRLLEQLHILTNYRLLPYGLGYGLRLGTAAAVRQGLMDSSAPMLAEIMAKAYYIGTVDDALQKAAEDTIATIKKV